MSHLVKGSLALGTAGTAAGGFYLGKELLGEKESKTIRQYLSDSGFQLISDLKEGEKEQWTEEFKSDKSKIKQLLGTSEDEDAKGGELLKGWCEARLKQGYSETNKDLDGVKNYCVMRTVASQLLRAGKKVLNPEDTNNTKWEATYNKRKSTTTLSPKSQIAGLTGSWSDSQDTKNNDLPIIKSWCKSKTSGLFLAKDKDSVYTPVENWCTEDGAKVEAQ
ncbi:hypothetical protein HF1_04340 [Mycoplasma haemofelis str. Langford 1]|uniref:Uncharacterized protein n=1 Tax=Mycoplasma haemofelis (strain Langford 1) TaxID=941640 RepID=E8ZH21_MYCHL|nr:hypothetical protein [Mycoplasma haemofelis]CBY92442.1 hypothetical protein HF1_04340 [Mycoplasma haemofelis str. Langford 1]